MTGATEETRTPDLLITNQLLCRLSYSSKKDIFTVNNINYKKVRCKCQFTLFLKSSKQADSLAAQRIL
jgi:hypothetical protein